MLVPWWVALQHAKTVAFRLHRLKISPHFFSLREASLNKGNQRKETEGKRCIYIWVFP